MPIPGASAALTALVASGLNTEQFLFFGFLPPKAGARRTALEDLAQALEEPRRWFFMRRRIASSKHWPMSEAVWGGECPVVAGS